MPVTRRCPDCDHNYVDTAPRRLYECTKCGTRIAPRRGANKELKLATKDNPDRVCVCCGDHGSKIFTVEGVRFLLCAVCNDFAQSYTTRELFFKYRKSGGANTWLAYGKQTLFDVEPGLGVVSDTKDRGVPGLKSLRQKPGSFRGGVPFGFNADGTKNEEQQLTLMLIRTYLARNQSLSSVCRELHRGKRLNKHGKISWSPSQIKFLARRDRIE